VTSVQVFVNDGKVVLRYVRKVWAARALTHRPDVRRGRFQAIVHSDMSFFRDLDSRLLKPDALRVRGTSNRHLNVRSLHGSCTVPRFKQLVQGKWKPSVTNELDGSTLEVSALLLDRENTLWIGTTNEGIYRIRGRDVDHFRGANGLSSDSVNGFYEDREGNLWVATSKGIDIFRDLRVVSFSSSEGLSADVVNSVLGSRDGAIWIGNPGALDSLRKGNITSIQQNHGLLGSQVTSLFEDRAGQLWVGIDDKLCIYKAGKFIPINEPDGKPVGAVTAITEDADDNIWAEVIDPNRLVHIHNRKVREDLAEPQVPRALTLAGDPGGGIWLGLLSGGLARYRDGHLETFPFERSPNSVPVRQIAVSSDGSVLGATSEGVMGLRDGKFQSLDARNGLPCNDIYSLI
jgi:ligand-binding sensor domain-containing protein